MFTVFSYFFLFLLLFLFFILTIRYKSSITTNLEKKKHPFKILYGTSFFLLDCTSSLKKKFFPNYSSHNEKLRKNLQQLHVGKTLNEVEYLFNAKRISYAYLLLWGCILFGLIYSINNLNSSKKIESLPRTNDETSYSLKVSIDGNEEQTLDITVDAKEYDFKETLELFETYRKDIVSAMLGKNSSIEEIQYPLNFISSYGDEGLTINWEVENENLIDNTGAIYPENIDAEGASTYVIATLTLGEHTTELTIPLVLVP